MSDQMNDASDEAIDQAVSRRQALRALSLAAVGAPFAAALGQGRCRLRLGAPQCDTTAINPVFEPTGWKTVLLDHITMHVADYRKEAAFYNALMGWKLRSDDGTQAVMDIGDFGSMVLKPMPPGTIPDTTGRGGGAGNGRGRAPVLATVESFCFGIEPWDAPTIDAELRKRGLMPVADNDGKGFESFHIKDPDGFDLQLSNGNSRNRRTTPANATLAESAPFASTGWKTVWLDHFSFNVADYKRSASFYCNLLGWKPTYDEGSQNECLIGDVGDIIIRGGNPLVPQTGRGGGAAGAAGAAGGARRARIDHISFGITPWDTDKVKADLESRGLRAQADTSTDDDIHVSAYKSYHTITPNGYNLQISYVNHDTRLTLPTAVRPRRPG